MVTELFGLRSDGIPSFQNNENGFRTVLMQYTGLKDKNGKEIYEFDLWQRDNTICMTEFKFAKWMLSYMRGPVQYPYAFNAAAQGEIIGNIYENPELLE